MINTLYQQQQPPITQEAKMLKPKTFYAATNAYSTESSIGFTNTWNVYAFKTKSLRDGYVADASDLSTRSIPKSAIGDYIEAAKPFSGLRRAIDDCEGMSPDNAFGSVELMYSEEGINI